jgi:hypothetical protein
LLLPKIDKAAITPVMEIAANPEGLQRAVTVQRLVHNWVRPHRGLRLQLWRLGYMIAIAGVAFIVRLSLPHVLTDQCLIA